MIEQATNGPSFDDPKPEPEKRKTQTIFLKPSLRAEIDRQRGKKATRSAWIEQAIIERLRRLPSSRV